MARQPYKTTGFISSSSLTSHLINMQYHWKTIKLLSQVSLRRLLYYWGGVYHLTGIVCCYTELTNHSTALHNNYNNIQATISAFWLVKSMSINPKSVQKSKIKCKKVKLSAKKWNWVQNGEIKMIDSSYSIVQK